LTTSNKPTRTGHLVAIIGPTGVGKSRLALYLARTFDGEIVNADSRQIYRYLDISTAKPRPEELALVPHHLISIVSPDEDFSLAQYRQAAYQAIDNIHRRGRLPLLVGGSGMYVWAVLEGWSIPAVPPDPELRRNLREKVDNVGAEALYQELLAVDPAAAKRIDRRNIRRVSRALEVYRATGVPFSQYQNKQPPDFRTLVIGLTIDRPSLYHLIDSRVDEMIKQGLIQEVEKLLEKGYDFHMAAMSGIGYRQIGQYIKGELTLPEAIEWIKFETHRLVRHQYSWFRLNDSRIHWFDIRHQPYEEIEQLIKEFRG
jgi:tRNA dimethylallyltransferase